MSKPEPKSSSQSQVESRRAADYGKIDFMGMTRLMFGISTLLTILAFVAIGIKGFNYGIDFAGGTEIQARFGQPTTVDEIRTFFESKGIHNAQIQGFTGTNDFSIRFENVKGATERETNEMTAAKKQEVVQGLQTTFAAKKVEILSQSTVGPQIGEQLKRNSLLAAFYSLLVILIYVGLRFDYNFAPGAVICLFHDAAITLGILCLLGREINVQILAAVLTLIGYSLNDTIVVFDRIRENIVVLRDQDLHHVINRSINETIQRTIMTSLTTFLSVLSLAIFAGGTIADFALTMSIGIIIGTYSSIYVAAPLIPFFDRFKHIGAQKA